MIEYANAELIKQLLPVLDNLERALTAGRDEAIPESFRQGIELIHTHACRTLERAGLEPIEAIGQLFDPDLHEAVLREPSAELPENIVVQEIQRGYSLKGRIIRHSMVSVSGRESRAESTSEGQ